MSGVDAAVPAATSRHVYRRILLTIGQCTRVCRAPLLHAAWCAYHAACYRALGAERLYATHALAMHRTLVDAHFARPDATVSALSMAIEALLRGQLDAALGHLEQIPHAAGVGRQPVTEGVHE